METWLSEFAMKGDKMPQCTYCEEYAETLEDWGCFKLCEKCVKEFRSDLPERPKRRGGNIITADPKLDAQAKYDPKTGNIKLLMRCYELGNVCESINHEVIHYILHGLIGLHGCYKFDNIYEVVDKYHGGPF